MTGSRWHVFTGVGCAERACCGEREDESKGGSHDESACRGTRVMLKGWDSGKKLDPELSVSLGFRAS